MVLLRIFLASICRAVHIIMLSRAKNVKNVKSDKNVLKSHFSQIWSNKHSKF